MAKNTHLEHLEDDILNHGSDGGKNAIAFLRELKSMLSEPQSQVRITTKWDGAPAIICGIHPEYNTFFVGTKSVFAKTEPKVCFASADVDYYYPNGGQLSEKLKACLEHLPKLGIKGVIQGDLLFTNDKSVTTISGTRNITFQPNTIVYAVPVGTELSSKIERAKVGIVFHTTYSGSTLSDMSAGFGVNIDGFNNTPDVYAATANFNDATGVATLNITETAKLNSLINRAEGSLKQASKFLDILTHTGESKFLMSTLFKQFFNTYIRQGKKFGSAKEVGANFAKYYSVLMDKEVATKKTQKTKDKYLKIKMDGLKFIKMNERPIYFTVASYMNIVESKNYIIRKLEKVNDFGTFLRTENGYRVTAPEGFVAIKSGRALKLVDRLEFSRANFTADKNWDKK